MAVRVSRNFQSMGLLRTSPKKPVSELIAIIKSDVPAAVFMGRPVNNTSAGIIKKPPPAPTNPVRNPMSMPSTMINNVWYFFLRGCMSRLPLIIGMEASTIRMANRPSNKNRFVNPNSPI